MEKTLHRFVESMLFVLTGIMLFAAVLETNPFQQTLSIAKTSLLIFVILLCFVIKFSGKAGTLFGFAKRGFIFCERHMKAMLVVLFALQILGVLYLNIFAKCRLDGDAGRLISWFGSGDSISLGKYFSGCPNNLLLGGLYALCNNLAVLQVINILVVNLSICYLYYLVQKISNKHIAFFTALAFFMTIGISPMIFVPYTDTLSFPLSLSLMHLVLGLLSQLRAKYMMMFIGLSGLAYLMKPSLIIYSIAGIIMLAFKIFNKNFNAKMLIRLVCLVLGMIIIVSCLSFLVPRMARATIGNEMKIGRETTMKSFFAMGLIGSGGFNLDFRHKYWSFKEDVKERDKWLDAFIKENLQSYGVRGTINHYISKIAIGGRDGSFAFRSFDYIISDNNLYHMLLSIYKKFSMFTWVLVLFGLFVFNLTKRDDMDTMQSKAVSFLALTLFGGIVFLELFEWGTSRYLIQFLPCILTLSALGYAKIYKTQKKIIV